MKTNKLTLTSGILCLVLAFISLIYTVVYCFSLFITSLFTSIFSAYDTDLYYNEITTIESSSLTDVNEVGSAITMISSLLLILFLLAVNP